MRAKLNLQKLYPVTYPASPEFPYARQIRAFAEGGATLAQLRIKDTSPRDFYNHAEEAVAVARALGIRLIINDRADVALALGADGVHLGQDDLPPAAARQLLGDEAVLGFSTHNVAQAIEASRLPINYVAIGPIFPTASKDRPHPVVGLDGLSCVRAMTGDMPLVAIGGITTLTARAVLEAGADSVAVIGALRGPTPEVVSRITRDLLASLS